MAHLPPSRSRGRPWLLVALVGALVLSSCSASSTSQPRRAEPTGRGQLTPLLDSTLSAPRWFGGADGKAYLVYELLLTNAIPAPVTLSALEVRDADSDATLIRLVGDSLRAATSLATSPDTATVLLPPASVGIVWLDIPLAGESAIPSAVEHQLTIDRPAGVPIPDSGLTFTGAAVDVDRQPPVVLGPPLAGAGWAALGSCCDGPHRRALHPIDGRWYLAQRFPTFGQPVYAVADGAVAAAVDRYPDLRVGEKPEEPTPDNAGGNHVVIDIGGGRFATCAHLQAESVTVKPGDRVRRSQHIANAGSSGTSGGPHLHFQVTDHPSVVVADGMPYVFNAFELTGQTPPLVDVLPHYDTLTPIPITTERTGARRDELPVGRDVVTFPAGGSR
jgi:murein DD-endopeptidase MepM/ murein hydrolase activator NlpD